MSAPGPIAVLRLRLLRKAIALVPESQKLFEEIDEGLH